MKANEAPEKIYLQVCGDCPQTDCDNCKFEDLEDNITWCKDKIFEKDIEYIRKDVFVKRAINWLRKELINFEEPVDTEKTFINDFKKAMEE